jgi:uncharacterized protein
MADRPARGQGRQSGRSIGLWLAWGIVLASLVAAVGWVLLDEPEPGTPIASTSPAEVERPVPLGPMTPAPAPRAEPAAPTVPPTGVAPPPAATPSPSPAPPGDRVAVAPIAPPAARAPATPAPIPGLPSVPALAPFDPTLVERGSDGMLPVVSIDGRRAWQAYARPFDKANRSPRISIIINRLGPSHAATLAAIQQLPSEVTLSFEPYGDNLDYWIRLARAGGHEVMIDLPMEPLNFPAVDPGPQTLLTSLTAPQNRERMEWVLSRAQGYVGVVNHLGSRFSLSEEHLKPVLGMLRDRGLLYVDSRAASRSRAPAMARDIGLPRATNDRFLDAEASRDSIDLRLREVERIARDSGTAVAIGNPYPVTIERVALWAKTLESRGLVLAPITASVDRQVER